MFDLVKMKLFVCLIGFLSLLETISCQNVTGKSVALFQPNQSIQPNQPQKLLINPQTGDYYMNHFGHGRCGK